jgi:hypothetical protein
MDTKVGPLVDLLEDFFGNEPARAVKDCSEATLRTALAAFGSDPTGKCLPKLALRVSPQAPGEDRSGFLDLLLPSSTRAPCIELKSITLDALWRGQNESTGLHSDQPLETLRKQLQVETEEELLRREVDYRRKKTTVRAVMDQAVIQIKRYLDVMKEGVASEGRHRVYDYRVRQSEGQYQLIGYVVILLGGTRALGWHVATECVNFMLHADAKVMDDSLIS